MSARRNTLRTRSARLPLPLALLIGGLLLLALVAFTRRVEDPDAQRILRNTSPASVTAAHTSEPLRLLLASHGRLLWYYPKTSESKVLHEGEGVHYGSFPGQVLDSGELKSVWVVVRPHNWHPSTSVEVLLELDAETGDELSRVQIPSRFTHDAVRMGNSVFVCDTDEGAVLELAYPSMQLVQRMDLFTRRQHVNTLALLRPGQFWAVLHNLGKSDLAQVRLPKPQSEARRMAESSKVKTGASVAMRITGIGTMSHGLVEWQGGFLNLDSNNAQLVWLELPSSSVEGGGRRAVSIGEDGAATLEAKVKVLWKSSDSGKFLKGLAVVDSIAYFGVSVFAPRSARQDPAVDSELAAFDLREGRLLWKRQVPTRGLLNIVAAPHLGEDSTFRPMSTAGLTSSVGTTSTTGIAAGLRRKRGSATVWHATPPPPLDVANQLHEARESLLSNTAVQEATEKLQMLGYPPRIGGHWGTGLPYLDLAAKATKVPWEAGLQLPLTMVDISALQALVAGTPAAMWEPAEQRKSNVIIDGRRGNTDQFKPGVKAIVMQFSDQSIDNTYRFPYYNYYKAALEPLLHQVIGADAINNIVRMQLAMMPVGSTIRLHRDMGGYALKAHRIHIPVFTNQDVSFEVCPRLDQRTEGHAHDEDIADDDDCVRIPMAEGMVFELNNRVIHRVLNSSPGKSRIQLVVDVAESPRPPTELKAGTRCQYVRATIVCQQ